MKKNYFFALTTGIFMSISAQSQVIFSSNFENWTSNTPDGWVGIRTNLEQDSIFEITTGTVYGTKAVELKNTESTHRRFSTELLNVDANSKYIIEFWAKGEGEVRAGLYDGGSVGFGYQYDAYQSVTSSWNKYTGTITAQKTTDSAEFLLSIRNTVNSSGNIMIDSFVVLLDTTPPTILSIYDIQYSTATDYPSSYLDQNVTVQGIVTASKNKRYYIQDAEAAWSGIYVFDNVNSPLVGDSVQITGTVKEYKPSSASTNGTLTQLTSITSFITLASGKTIQPLSLTTGDLTEEQYEGVLVKVMNAACVDTVQYGPFGTFGINDGTGKVVVDDDFYKYLNPIIGNVFTEMIGVASYSFDERKLLPREVSDITVNISSLTFSKNIKVYPNPVSEVLMIELPNTEIFEITIHNILGELVYQQSANNSMGINMNNLNNGTYFLTILSNNQVFTQKILVK